MGEEAFYETVLAADTGTVYVRGGYGRTERVSVHRLATRPHPQSVQRGAPVWLGVSEGNTPDEPEPEYEVELTPRQQHALIHAIAACRWVIEWQATGNGGLQYELMDADTLPVLLLTIEPISVSGDLLSRYRASAWDQATEGDDPLYRVTTESLALAKRALEDWWTLHGVNHGASVHEEE